MAISSKQYIEASNKRKEEYKKMREYLLNIALSSDTSAGDRIAAINTIYKIDADGIPLPYNHH